MKFTPEARIALASQQTDRFWKKVRKTDTCWLWLTGTCKDGYGKFAITTPRGTKPKQIHVRAHRLSWELVNGPADPALVTMHSCDVPACVNPAHLTMGTQADNRIDCGLKCRNACGDKNGATTHAESRRLRRGRRRLATSQYRGVSTHTRSKSSPWNAHIRFSGKTIYLGRFATEIDAAKAYDRAAMDIFGKFARTNGLDE